MFYKTRQLLRKLIKNLEKEQSNRDNCSLKKEFYWYAIMT